MSMEIVLEAYHFAWLSVHPNRSVKWLEERLRDGFDVHHLDGDHENNTPANLVLIEHGDHMGLHNGGTVILGRLKRSPARGARNSRLTRRKREKNLADAKARMAAIGWPSKSNGAATWPP